MDPLALLCNLHGDGPSTLQRLRRAGCDTLAGLEDIELKELAGVLGWKETKLERFIDEARHLAARLGEGLLEDDELEDDIDTEVESQEFVAHQGEVPIEAALDEEDLDEEELGEEGTFDEPIQVEVLDRWRELDEEAARGVEELEEDVVLMPPAPPPTPVAPISLAPPVPLGSGSSGLTGEPPPGISLRAARIDGLSEEWLEGLERAGVGSLEELIEAPELGLARRSGIAYTQILRLQFLARRVAARGAPGASPAPAAAQPPAEQRLDAAGPFA